MFGMVSGVYVVFLFERCGIDKGGSSGGGKMANCSNLRSIVDFLRAVNPS